MIIVKKKVFVSYSSKDSTFVEQLVSDLDKLMFEIWEYRQEILPGDAIPQKIGEALKEADFYVIILSPNSVNSRWVELELNTALEIEVSQQRANFIIPVLYQDCKIPAMISSKRYANFVTNYHIGMQELSRALEQPAPNSKDNLQKKTGPPISIVPLNVAGVEISRKLNQMSELRPDFEIGKTIGELRVIGPSLNGTYCVAQYFEHGIIVWHLNNEFEGHTIATYGSINHRYQLFGEKPWENIGFPVKDEAEATCSPFLNNKGENNKGRYSSFENGEICWYWIGEYRDQTYAILDPFRKEYDAIGGSGSYLGFPISEPYQYIKGKRCDFEGGAIISLNNDSNLHIVRNLLQINYGDSPFLHNWVQYAGQEDADCASVRLDTRIGLGKSYIAFNFPWDGRAIYFPEDRYADGLITQRYCALTVKSLAPNLDIRFYIKLKTNEVRPQFLEYDSQITAQRFVHDTEDDVDYLRFPISKFLTNGDWHTIIIDLDKVTKLGFQREFECIKAFYFRGHIGIADIMVSDSRNAIEAIAINPIYFEGENAD